ncbi:hypothetical protein CAEBREN_24546 [Caenorhabditis brenneri]|uniref:GHMP kinase N-terminal domain-containing protein n=1 Tax=Caenorhabditis brenneri TaxID=135651 RepID=G0N3Z9_CAEBE|nr:hypothetical protein CAEBREN_24546 [Caenorhabditis brenneri]
MRWDIITFSLGHGIDPKLIEPDVQHFQNLNFPNCEEFLVVNDASEDVGSGGSALNALIRTAERLCYRKNYTVLAEAVLQDVNILIVLVNNTKTFLCSEYGINGGNGYIFETALSKAINSATEVANLAKQKGLWIIGTDTTWETIVRPKFYDFPQDNITGFAAINPTSIKGFGWYKTKYREADLVGMSFDGEVSGQTPPPPRPDQGNMILAFLYLPVNIATAFLSLYNEFPVAATTYLGVDSNVTPLKLSLFFDLMLATCISEEEFISSRLGTGKKISENEKDRTNARIQIYKKIGGFKGRVEVLQLSSLGYRKFSQGPPRDYSKLVLSVSERYGDKKPIDLERTFRTHFSIDKMKGVPVKQTISKMLSLSKTMIQEAKSCEEYLHLIFHASFALSLASEGKGGLRNGPAKNPIFEKLMQGSSKKVYLTAIFQEILSHWLGDPSMMIRAARHLETAGQKCIREMVDEMCAGKTLKLLKSDGKKCVSAKVTAPVRIDFFGGWLDTPPIFFSMKNAAVVNMAIQLDGKNPITCHVTKINGNHIELRQDGTVIFIAYDKDLLQMHDKPSEVGTLVCACIVALGFLYPSDLFETLECTGLRIETKSDLPHGSGLGTSSIMACTILKALCALGKLEVKDFSVDAQIIHTVLRVEQIMTTGGGWQDQCGAVFGGLKKCFYERGQGVLQTPISLSKSVKETLETRLMLVYTGKTRLAKNLLQEVIRNFFTCAETNNKLEKMASSVNEFVAKIQKGEVGVELLEQYHNTKNFMTRCEPVIVTNLLETLKDNNMIEVGWCAGAGGGGFLYLWLTPDTNPSDVKKHIGSLPQFSEMTFHTITIATDTPITLEVN